MKKMILAVLVTATLMACDSATNSNESNNFNGNGTALTGSVLTSDGKPVVGAKITIKSTKQSVYTDANGKWSLNVSTTKASIGVAGQAVAGRSLAGTDSAVVSKDSQYIASQPIVSYTAELPALYIVQRDLYGNLGNAVPGETYTITAVMAFPDSSRKTIALWHNAVAKSFSGFIYTVYDPGVTRSYNVQVTVRDHDSVVTGVSPVVPFTDAAGDVLIPVFGYENTKPKINRISVAGGYTAGSTVVLGVVYGDSDIVNGIPVLDTLKNTVEWKHGDSAWVTAKSMIVKLDSNAVMDPCYSVRVTDNETYTGISSVDSMSYCLEAGGNTTATRTMVWYRYATYGLLISATGDTSLGIVGGRDSTDIGTDTLQIDRLSHAPVIRNHTDGTADTSWLDVTPASLLNVIQLGSTGYVSETSMWLSKPMRVVVGFNTARDTIELKAGDNTVHYFNAPTMIFGNQPVDADTYKAYLLGQNTTWKPEQGKVLIKSVKTYK